MRNSSASGARSPLGKATLLSFTGGGAAASRDFSSRRCETAGRSISSAMSGREASSGGVLPRPSRRWSRLSGAWSTLSRLLELGLVEREIPFGASERDSKRSRYRIADPFLSFWFRFAAPHRALVEARRSNLLERELAEYLPVHTGEVWERLARLSVPRLALGGRRWLPASRWWGGGLDRQPLEIDIVAASDDGSSLLVGEAKLRLGSRYWSREIAALGAKIERFPPAQGRNVIRCIWCAAGGKAPPGVVAVDARRVLRVLK